MRRQATTDRIDPANCVSARVAVGPVRVLVGHGVAIVQEIAKQIGLANGDIRSVETGTKSAAGRPLAVEFLGDAVRRGRARAARAIE